MKNLKFYKAFKIFCIFFMFIAEYLLSSFFATIIITSSRISPKTFFDIYAVPLISGCVIIALFIFIFRIHKVSFIGVDIIEALKIGIINLLLFISNVIITLSNNKLSLNWCLILLFIYFALSYVTLFAYRFFNSLLTYTNKKKIGSKENVLIIGAGAAGITLNKEIKNSDKISFNVVGFIDDDPNKLGNYIYGTKVLGTSNDILDVVKSYNVNIIFIAMPSVSAKRIKEISTKCIETKCQIKTIPGIYQLLNGQTIISKMRDVDVQDLLGREPIKLNTEEVMEYIDNQVVMVTGGGGSIGSELCRQIATHNPKQLIILDIYENSTYDIEQELKRKYPNLNLLALIASVRDSIKMDDVFKKYRPDIVFHAAAHKHVPLMETSPNEAVKNNILGTYKVVKCADKYEVKRFVQISTDKAVNPTNIMGATKRVCEMIIQTYAKRSKTKFVAVRFGNVLGSNGSVIPLFKKQIAEGGPVTVTHKDIIRYFMTIPEAVSLVLQAGAYANGGEIFVLDMGEPVKIYDLAVNLIRLSGFEPGQDIEIKITGLRPGEKLYEERLMAEEGMAKTANERISIGKPLDIDEEKLLQTLDLLYKEAYQETDAMKELVKGLVPTYHIDKRTI